MARLPNRWALGKPQGADGKGNPVRNPPHSQERMNQKRTLHLSNMKKKKKKSINDQNINFFKKQQIDEEKADCRNIIHIQIWSIIE